MTISICVFCGSRYGADPRFRAAATRFGELAGSAQIRLIYGGGHVGLMGAVADAAIAAGGEVTGLIPTRLLEREVGHRAITELVVTKDMFERKQQMIDRADAFVVLPGGLGTLDELFEVWTTATLSLHRKPILLLDFDGFYSGLLEWLRSATEQEFIRPEAMAMMLVSKDVHESLDLVEEAIIRA
jgi:uncharacterized protein (TIGR00730 family)